MATRRFIKSPWFWILIVIISLILTFVVWYGLPLRHPPQPAFSPGGSIAYINTRLDPDSEEVQLAVREARLRFLGEAPGWLKETAFNLALKIGLPKGIGAWVVPGESATDPDLILTAAFGRGGRLIRLLGSPFIGIGLYQGQSQVRRTAGRRIRYAVNDNGPYGLNAFTFVKDTMILGSNVGVIESSLSSAKTENIESVFLSDISDLLEDAQTISFMGDNRSRELTDLIRVVEEKTAFSIMPSADGLTSVSIKSSMIEGIIVGQASFLFEDAGRIREGKSDVRFLYGVIRRLLKPRGADMKGETRVENTMVLFDFTIPDAELLLKNEQE